MSEFSFEKLSEDQISISNSGGVIVRTLADFAHFHSYLQNKLTSLLVPLLEKEDYVDWMKRLIHFNKNYKQFDDLRNFLINEEFFIEKKEDEMGTYLKQVSAFISKNWPINSEFKNMGIFVDGENEKALYRERKNFVSLESMCRYIKETFETKVELNRLLNKKCAFLSQNLKYFISEDNSALLLNNKFSNETKNSEISGRLEELIKLIQTAMFFFHRKDEIYGRYKKAKEAQLKNKFQSHEVQETMTNHQRNIDEIEQVIREYNKNLLFFSESHEDVISLSGKMDSIVKEINELHSITNNDNHNDI